MAANRTTARAVALLAALVCYVVTVAILMAALFFPVILLAGPHSDLLPGWLQSVVLVVAWVVVLGLPVMAGRWVYRRVAHRGGKGA